MPNDNNLSPWRRFRRFKAPSKKVLYVVGAIVAVLILATAPLAFVDAYNSTIHTGAGKDAALLRGCEAFGLVSFLWVLQAGMLTLVGCVIVPDLIAMYRGIKSAVLGIPSAYRKTRDWLGRTSRATINGIRALPAKGRALLSKVRAMNSADWFGVFFTASALAIVAGLFYLNWGIAPHIQTRLPNWMMFAHGDIMDRILIDMFMSLFEFAFVMPFWAALCRVLGKALLGKKR